MVSGHVDGTATVVSFVEQGGGFWSLIVHMPQVLGQWVIPQGSLAVGGVSLTVVTKEWVASGAVAVSFMLVPHTLVKTNLGDLKEGQKVEVECDSQVKAVCMTLEQVLPGKVLQGGS